MKPLLYAMSAIIACLIVAFSLLGVGTISQAVPLDTNLNVCLPPVKMATPNIPKSPVELETTPQFDKVKPRTSAAADLGTELAMVTYHLERVCGKNGCQMVSVPDAPKATNYTPPTPPQACTPAQSYAPPQACTPAAGEGESRTARTPLATAASRLRVFKRMRERRQGE